MSGQRSGGFKKNDPRTKALGDTGRQVNNFLRKFREKKKGRDRGSAAMEPASSVPSAAQK